MTLETKRFIIAALGGLFLLSLVFVQWLETARKGGRSRPAQAPHGRGGPRVEGLRGAAMCRPTRALSITGEARPTPRKASLASNAIRRAEQDADAYLSTTARPSRPWSRPATARAVHTTEGRAVRRQPPRQGRQHPGLARQLPGRDRRGRADGLQPPLADSGQGGRHGQRLRQRLFRLPAVPRLQGGAAVDRWRHDHHRRPRARRRTACPPTSTPSARWCATTTAGRKFHAGTWPNTGIGRINLDGSRGSCSACHSRHDFSPRRARQPENCGKCHLGPDHPQKEIYEESKHGVAYRDLKDDMNLDAKTWVLGEDYSAAPTCATCHMSATCATVAR